MAKVSIPKLHSIRMKNHSNVEWLEIPTRNNIDPNNVLLGAINHGLTDVVICGFDKRGEEYFSSSIADGGDTIWIMERMKKMLLEVPDR